MAETSGRIQGQQDRGRLAAAFYEKARRTARVLKPHEIPWEQSAQGRKKDLTRAVAPYSRT